jgi:hypothetical protein
MRQTEEEGTLQDERAFCDKRREGMEENNL